ncbi:MAG: PAS domain S-box protein, partial [Pirellulaceae bacterium]|nr:PAS domain S-box protein [Pirellulaceae bacterium]
VGQHVFSVVILDHQLPDATADDFLPELKRLIPDSEVIVVTGYAEVESTIAALQNGAADYIVKPINPDVLRKRVKRIVDLRRIESQWHHEQRFSEQILDTVEALILVLDLNAKIVRINPYFQRLTGWTLDEVQGKDWFDVFIPESDKVWLREVFMKTAADIQNSGVVNKIITKSGRELQIRWSNTTLIEDSGTVKAVLAAGVDITDLLSSQKREMQSKRLAAIGETMAALSHESRNALQRILAGVEMLSCEIKQDSPAFGDLQMIKRATSDLNELLEEVRSYGGPIQLHVEPTTLSKLAQRAWKHLDRVHGPRDARMVEHFLESNSLLTVDVMRMEQVFRNLFENALDACSDPVKIEISCQFPDQDSIQILVHDNGPGLDHEQHEKLFEPFYTTKSAGTGLGMSICRRIIEAHRGSISVGPSTAGTTIVIEIPRVVS